MKQYLSIVVAFAASFVFAVGLSISGMTQPKYVVGFLDIFGDWKPQLAFVMIGAILVYAPLNRFFLQKKPLLSDRYFLPEKIKLDWKLCLGSILFGVGWGLGGYCPGPAVTSVSSLSVEILVFVGTMIFGIKMFEFLNKRGLFK